MNFKQESNRDNFGYITSSRTKFDSNDTIYYFACLDIQIQFLAMIGREASAIRFWVPFFFVTH